MRRYHFVDGKWFTSTIDGWMFNARMFMSMLCSYAKNQTQFFSCGCIPFCPFLWHRYLFARTRVNVRPANRLFLFFLNLLLRQEIVSSFAAQKKTIEFRIAFTFFSPTCPNRDFRTGNLQWRKNKTKTTTSCWSRINQAKHCFCITVLNWTINKFLPQIWLNALYIC